MSGRLGDGGPARSSHACSTLLVAFVTCPLRVIQKSGPRRPRIAWFSVFLAKSLSRRMIRTGKSWFKWIKYTWWNLSFFAWSLLKPIFVRKNAQETSSVTIRFQDLVMSYDTVDWDCIQYSYNEWCAGSWVRLVLLLRGRRTHNYISDDFIPGHNSSTVAGLTSSTHFIMK